MSSLSCPLCGSPDTVPSKSYGDIGSGHWNLRRCSRCGTMYLHPVPDLQTLHAYYDADYYGQGDGKFFGPVERVVRLFRYLRAKSIQRFAPSGPVLDVGCGRGLMLSFLKTWGYKVDGIELDSVAAKRAERNLEQEIFNSLEDIKSSHSGKYQAVCFWHSLEHLPQSGQALRAADFLLAPGGLLVLSAPHATSIQSRLSGKRWLHLDLPRHLVHFDMNRLCAFLQHKGYDLLKKQHFSQEYNVIDTLCYLYSILGFDPLYPFNILKGSHGYRSCKCCSRMSLAGVSLLFPLGVVAFLGSNLFSVLRSGSTVTLFLRKNSKRVPV